MLNAHTQHGWIYDYLLAKALAFSIHSKEKLLSRISSVLTRLGFLHKRISPPYLNML